MFLIGNRGSMPALFWSSSVTSQGISSSGTPPWVALGQSEVGYLNFAAVAEVIMGAVMSTEGEMTESMNAAIEFVLNHEQYCGKDLGDGAGLTIWGITEKWFKEDVDKMRRMSVEESRKYARDFPYARIWKEAGCGALRFPLDIIHFDTDVMMGRDDSIKMMKNSSGPNTYLIARFYELAKMRDTGSVVAKKNMSGWLNRTLDLVKLVMG